MMRGVMRGVVGRVGGGPTGHHPQVVPTHGQPRALKHTKKSASTQSGTLKGEKMNTQFNGPPNPINSECSNNEY